MTGCGDLLPVIARTDAEVSTFSEWTTGTPERQHAALDALDQGPDGLAQTDRPEWRRVAEFSDNTNVKRYREHRSLSVAATTS